MIVNNQKIKSRFIEVKKTGSYQKIFFELSSKSGSSSVIVVFDTVKDILGLVWMDGQKDIEKIFDMSKKPEGMEIEKYIDLKCILVNLWNDYKSRAAVQVYYEEVPTLFDNSNQLKVQEGPSLAKIKRRLSLDRKNSNSIIKIYSDRNRNNLVSYKKGAYWHNSVEV